MRRCVHKAILCMCFLWRVSDMMWRGVCRIDGAPGDGLSSPSSGGSQPLLAGGASSGRRRQTSGDSTNSPGKLF